MAGSPVIGRRRVGGVLNITAATWTAGFQWWRSGDITRTQNVSEYMLVLALCLVDLAIARACCSGLHAFSVWALRRCVWFFPFLTRLGQLLAESNYTVYVLVIYYCNILRPSLLMGVSYSSLFKPWFHVKIKLF